MNTQEKNTIQTADILFGFISEMSMSDKFEQLRFNATEKSDQWLQLLRKQYATVQHGNSKSKPKAGELPNTLVKSETQRLYNSLKTAATLEKREFKCSYETFYTEQHRLISFYLRTGKVKNRAKTTLIADALEQQSEFEKKLAAQKAIADKAALDKKKADADAVKAFANADAVKADADVVIIEISDLIDSNPNHADAVKSELSGIVDAVKADVVKVDAIKADAVKIADKAQTTKDKADADVNATKKELDKIKTKLANLTAGKASNTQAEPKLNFKTTNFSQDCKDTALMILEELEREATSAPELLYLAKLILDKYNK
jgi:hypothetical protein